MPDAPSHGSRMTPTAKQSSPAWSRFDGLVLAAFAAAAMAFWRLDVLSVTSAMPSFAGFDLFTEFLPRHHYAGEVLRAGRLPLWDPTQAAGLPFAATWQAGVFYPFNVLHALLPTGLAMGVLARLHLFLCGMFAYLLAREVGQHRIAAALAGVTYMLCGSTVFMMYHTCAMSAAPWLPAALLCTLRLGRRPGVPSVVALAAVLALAFLAGRDFAFVMTAHAVGFLALAQLAMQAHDEGFSRDLARHAGFLGAAAVLSAGLAAIQAVPTLDLAARSSRTVSGLPPGMLEPFGPMPPQFFLANLVTPTRGPIRREYFGWIPLLLAFVGLTDVRTRRAAAASAALGATSLLLVFGSQTPAYAWYAALPLASVFRLPDRFVFLFAIALALLAGFGLDRLLGRRHGRTTVPLAGLAAAAAFVVAIGTGAATGFWKAEVARTARPWGWLPFYGLTLEHFAGFGMAAAAGIAALVLLVAAAAWSRRLAAAPAGALIVILAAADLLHAFRSATPHPEAGVSQAFSAADCYRRLEGPLGPFGRHLSLRLPDSYALKEKDGELFGTFSATHYDPLVTRRHALFFGLLQDGARFIVDSPWNETSAFMGMLSRGIAPERLPLLDLLGVRAVLVDARPDRRPPVFGPLLDAYPERDRCIVKSGHGPAPVALLANPNAMPRASILFDTVEVADVNEAAAALGRAGFDPSSTIVLEPGGAPARPPAAPDPQARATIQEYSDERVVVDVSTRSPGMLLLTDAWDPEWVASIDGEPVEIRAADVLFRAVAVDAGDSRVTFEYRPTAFRAGAFATMVALGAAAAWLAIDRRRRPRRQREHLQTAATGSPR